MSPQSAPGMASGAMVSPTEKTDISSHTRELFVRRRNTETRVLFILTIHRRASLSNPRLKQTADRQTIGLQTIELLRAALVPQGSARPSGRPHPRGRTRSTSSLIPHPSPLALGRLLGDRVATQSPR